MKKFVAMLAAFVLTALSMSSAMACTMIYVGKGLTEDGSTYFARSEDLSNSMNKVFYVSPAGNHQAGEQYEGCYGFTYTFSKDSYAYTAFRDDNLLVPCPDCGQTHPHTPYEEAGTNEKGVSVTATVTLSAKPVMWEADSFTNAGIEEAEIVTVLLSEAATAKEALELLMNIYNTVGAAGASGILIADPTETWYIENCSGTQYLAMKLPEDLIFISPNMSVIGQIDLDDENVIASPKLIETAQNAGTFVGDAEAHIIDFRTSYANANVNDRMANGLHYLNATYNEPADAIVDADFVISNLKEGEITGLYTAITVDHPVTIAEMVDFYKVSGIGNTSNQEYHIFQIDGNAAPETGIVEWVGMDHGACGVMVPHYPLLTKDTYAGYQVGTQPAAFVAQAPETDAPYYPATKRGEEGFKVLPENWADSYYWSFDAVSNYLLFVDSTNAQAVLTAYAALQEEIYAAFADMKAAAAAAEDLDALADEMTAASSSLAQKAHETAVALYQQISAK